MKRFSRLQAQNTFLASAVLAAHSGTGSEGFRLKDVQFMFELFLNWVHHGAGDSGHSLQPVQIKRYLSELEGLGAVRTKTSKPYFGRFTVTRLGLIELITRIQGEKLFREPEKLFFSVYFISNYRDRLLQLVESEGPHFPLSVKLEIETLLNVRGYLTKQISLLEREITLLTARCRSAVAGADMAEALFRKGQSLSDVAEEVEKSHPYELSSAKPLKELIRELEPGQRKWELTTGTRRRGEQIFQPLRDMRLNLLSQMKQVLNELPSASSDKFFHL